MTVAYLPPKVYHNGTMTFRPWFQTGWPLCRDRDRDRRSRQRLGVAFSVPVGLYTVMGMIEYIFSAVGFAALCGFLWYLLGQRAQKTPAPAATALSN